MLAEWLSLPFMGYVRKIEVDAAGVAQCELALEESVEVVEAKLPAVVAVVSENQLAAISDPPPDNAGLEEADRGSHHRGSECGSRRRPGTG